MYMLNYAKSILFIISSVKRIFRQTEMEYLLKLPIEFVYKMR